MSPRFRQLASVVVVVVSIWNLAGVLQAADDATSSEARGQVALSLESLYHPKHKHDFDGSLPATHWIDTDPSRLLIQREETWMEVDLASGSETVWPVAEQLARHLAQLDGVNQVQARSAASRAVRSMDFAAQTILVSIDDSLAVVSAIAPARWVTRDADQWHNTSIDRAGRWLAYTRDGDLHLVDLADHRDYKLTDDGLDTLLDGALDWTYQEEIYGRGNFRGYWFSHDGQWLAMLRIDTAAIEPYALAASENDRGQGDVTRYPKAGDPIPHASLHLWDLNGLSPGTIPKPRLIAESTPNQQRILSGVWWSPHDNRLVYCISDRLQSWRELRMLDVSAANRAEDPMLLLREESETWIEPPQSPRWTTDGRLFWRSAIPWGTERLIQISAASNETTPVTPAKFTVSAYDVDAAGSQAIVTGSTSESVGERHAYRVDLTQTPLIQIPLTKEPGWHDVRVSPDGASFVDRFSTPTLPPRLVLEQVGTARRRVLAESRLDLDSKLFEPQRMTILAEDGFALPALLIRPEFASSAVPVPVVIEVYGGPQTPVVTSRWGGKRTLYRELLARHGIATLVVDNRSSVGIRSADSWPIHRRVGEVEFQDLITAVDWLKSKSWVDADHLAVRGWSFGGFLTLYAMTHSDAFAAGIAGGSVSDWREYDAFYTERYMGLPADNQTGYDSTAPVRSAAQLHGRLLMIHGEADDNVHPSNTLRMAAALQRSGKLFDLMIYPGAAHAIQNPEQAWHLARLTHEFLLEHLTRRTVQE